MRRAARTDSNHSAVVAALRNAGCLVQSLADIGKGVPDLLVAFPGRQLWQAPLGVEDRKLCFMEVKDGAKVPSARKLTTAQVKWHAEWAGAPLVVVETVEQALAAIQ